MILLAMSFAVAAVTSATWTPPKQSGEPVLVYFYLNHPDRSTREHWRGERLDLATLQEWSHGLAAAIADRSTVLRPVEKRQEADVVIEIRRCQVLRDTEFVMGGFIKTQSISEPFEMSWVYSPSSLKASVQGIEGIIERTITRER